MTARIQDPHPIRPMWEKIAPKLNAWARLSVWANRTTAKREMNDMMTQTTAAIRMPEIAAATAGAHTSGLSTPYAAMVEMTATPPK